MIFELAFCQILRPDEEHMAEKFDKKQAKKGNFNKQMEFRKKSNQVGVIMDINFIGAQVSNFLGKRNTNVYNQPTPAASASGSKCEYGLIMTICGIAAVAFALLSLASVAGAFLAGFSVIGNEGIVPSIFLAIIFGAFSAGATAGFIYGAVQLST